MREFYPMTETGIEHQDQNTECTIADLDKLYDSVSGIESLISP